MRRISRLLAVAAAGALLVAACSSDNSGSNSTTAATTGETTAVTTGDTSADTTAPAETTTPAATSWAVDTSGCPPAERSTSPTCTPAPDAGEPSPTDVTINPSSWGSEGPLPEHARLPGWEEPDPAPA